MLSCFAFTLRLSITAPTLTACVIFKLHLILAQSRLADFSFAIHLQVEVVFGSVGGWFCMVTAMFCPVNAA